MDLVTLVTLCSVAFDPGLMHALVIAESEGKPWSFRSVDGALKSFATAVEAAAAARRSQTNAPLIRVGLTGLPTDLLGVTAQPNEGLFEPCPNVALASFRLARRIETCRVRYPTEHAERCALATFHAEFEAPDWVFADEIMTSFAVGNLPNPEVSRRCEVPSTETRSDARDATESARPRVPMRPNSRSIFVPLNRDRR